MKALSITFLLVFTLVSGCKSTQEVDTKSELTQTVQDMPEGMTAGVIVAGKSATCAYTILCDDGTKLDPTELDDAYKKAGTKVWFKYRGLRMAPRCNGITMAAIEVMQMAK